MPWFALILSLAFFFSVPSFADPDDDADTGAAATQPAGPQRVELQFEFAPELLTQMGDDHAVILELLQERLRKELFTWGNFTVALPPSSFDAGTKVVQLATFMTASADADIEKAAFDERGKRKKLTPEQWRQLKEESIFTVESPSQPGQFYVWQVTNTSLHRGGNVIRVRLQKGLANGYGHIAIDWPDAFVGKDTVSFRASIANALYGIRNTLSLIVGLPERKQALRPDEVEARVNAVLVANLQEKLKGTAKQLGFVASIQMFDEEKLQKAEPVVAAIYLKAATDWTTAQQAARLKVEKRLKDLGVTAEAYPQALADAMQAEWVEFAAGMIERSPELRAIDAQYPRLVANHQRAQYYIRYGEARFAADLEAYEKEASALILAEHPVRGRNETFLSARVTAAVRARYATERGLRLAAIARDLEDRGLKQEAFVYRATMEFEQAEGPALRTQLEAELTAARRFGGRRIKIWNPRNWIVTKKTEGGRTRYVGDDYAPMPEVHTEQWFWRLRNWWQRTRQLFKGGVSFLVYDNWVNGPLGVRSLLKQEPFPRYYYVNAETGEVVGSTETWGTLRSRFWEGEASIRAARDAFEAKPDKGFLSKKFLRIFNVTWHSVIRRIFQPVLFQGGQIVGTVLNTCLTVPATVFSWAWAPVLAAVPPALTLTFYDPDGAKLTQSGVLRHFPVVAEIAGRTGIFGVLNFGLSALRAFYEPGMALGHTIGAGANWLWGSGVDWTTRQMFAVGGARLPAVNPTFVLTLIKGPGVAETFFYELSRESALAAMMAQAEVMELDIVSEALVELAREPETTAARFLAPYAWLLGDRVSRAGAVMTPVMANVTPNLEAIKKAVDARKEHLKGLLTVVKHAEGRIKMRRETLETVVRQGAVLTEQFFNGRVLAEASAGVRAKFWADRREGDWVAVTRHVMTSAFGDEVMVPVEKTGETFRVKVDPPGVGELLTRVLSGAKLDLDGRPLPEWSAASGEVVDPTIAVTQPYSCRNQVAGYRHGIHALDVRFRGN